MDRISGQQTVNVMIKKGNTWGLQNVSQPEQNLSGGLRGAGAGRPEGVRDNPEEAARIEEPS